MFRLISLFLLLIITLNFSASAQYYFVLSNQDTVSCDGYKKKRSSYVLKFSKKESIEIPSTEVLGGYKVGGDAFFYNKVLYKDGADSPVYQLVPKIVEGRINVYRNFISNFNQQLSNNLTVLYLEKDDQWFEVFYNSVKRKKYFESMIQLTSDDPEISEIIKSDFNYTYSNVLNLVRMYNLKFPLATNSLSSSSNQVVLKRNFPKQLKEPINVSIDGNNYSLDINETIQVSLPVNTYSMICISYGEDKVCDMIRASPLVKKVYLLGLDKKNGLEIDREVK